MVKRILLMSTMIALLLNVNSSLVTIAAQNQSTNTTAEGIAPFWVNTSVISLNISFNNGTATCSGFITGNTNVTKITATYNLQRQNSNGTFTTLKTWSKLAVAGRFHTFEETYSVTKGYTYRLSVSATVVPSSGSLEVVSTYVDKTY